MSKSGESDGWSPLDPDLTGDRPSEPPPSGDDRPPGAEVAPPGAEPPSWQSPHGHGAHPQGPPVSGPYVQGPYVQGPYAQSPYGQGPYAQGPYAQGPYAQGPYAQGPYGQDAYGTGAYPQPYAGYGMPPVKTSWTVEAPAGTPFHRLARNGVHRWWRPPVGTLMIIGIGMGLLVGVMLVGQLLVWAFTGEPPEPEPDETSLLGHDTADLALNLIMIAVFLPVVLLAAWAVQRRRPGTLSSVVGRIRWKWLLICCGLAVGFCVVAFGASLIAEAALDDPSSGDEEWVGWGEFLLPALVILLFVPFQAAAEEYMFRGWIQQAVGACTLENAKRKAGRAFSVVFRSPWPGVLIASAVFTAGHGYTGWGMLDIFLFAVVMGWLTVLTGGLEAAIALHVFNNLMAFMFSAAVGELDIVQGAVPWQLVIADVVPVALFGVAAVLLARRLRVQTVSPAPAEADDTPATADSSPAPVP